MTRQYSMCINIEKFKEDKFEEIAIAIEKEWNIEGTFGDEKTKHSFHGDSSLTGGETEDEFAKRVAKAIWRANGGACDVTVHATYLEDLPCETYCFDTADYEKFEVEENE